MYEYSIIYYSFLNELHFEYTSCDSRTSTVLIVLRKLLFVL